MLLPEDVRHALISFRSALDKVGIRSVFTSGFRSFQKQSELYTLFKGGLSPYPVAPPGASLHQTGRAVDLVITPHDAYPEAGRIGEKYGFKWAGPSDVVHFSYVYPQPGAAVRVGGVRVNLELPVFAIKQTVLARRPQQTAVRRSITAQVICPV